MSTDAASKLRNSSSVHQVRVVALLSLYLLIRLLALESLNASPVHIQRRLMPLRRHHQESPSIPVRNLKEKMISRNGNRDVRDISPSVDEEMSRLNRGSTGYTFTFIRQQGNRTLTRKESQDSSGFLKGIYWIQDPNGIFRLISYEADPDQRFQAQVLTNRPGEVNVTFPSDFPISRLQQPSPASSQMPPVSLMRPKTTTKTTTETKRLMSRPSPSTPCTNRPDEASLSPFSGRSKTKTPAVVSSHQVSSNCSAKMTTDMIAPEDLLMTTSMPTTDSSQTTDMTADASTSEMSEFETFTTTAATMAVTTMSDYDSPDEISPVHEHAHVHADGDDDDDESGVTESTKTTDHGRRMSNYRISNVNEFQPASTTTAMDEISDSEHGTASGISVALSMSTTESVGEDITSTSTSSYSTTFAGSSETTTTETSEVTDSVTTVTAVTTTGTASATEEKDSHPPAPVPDQPIDGGGGGSSPLSSGAMSALRYFLEYRIELMNGGPSIYRKEGTDSQGKVIGSYMFLVRDKDEDINHKREQLTKRNNMTQELIKIIQV